MHHHEPPLHLQLTTAAAAYRPGDTVFALLQASSRGAVELQEVELLFTGVERVDTSWVSAAYRRDVPPINADKRHLQRHVVQSRLQAAMQGTLGGSKDRKFVIRFTLPSSLPPTFRGTAVRVSYMLQASVHFRLTQPGSASPAPSSPRDSLASFAPSEAASEQTPLQTPQQEAAGAGDGNVIATVQLPLHVWPLKVEREGAPLPSPGTSGEVPPPLLNSEDMPIKCWEIGPGTGVQEAIAHISRLMVQQAAATAAAAALSAGRAAADAAQQQQQQQRGGDGGSEAADRGDSSGSSEGDEVDLSQPSPSQQLPMRRQSTADAERGGLSPLQPVPTDPSAVLRSYALRIGEHAIARVSLHPPVEGTLHPGATLAGTLELIHPSSSAADGEASPAGPAPRCMQVLILLETEERIAQQWRAAGKAGPGVIRRVYEEQLDLTSDLACTHFMFTVPPDGQANFSGPLLALQWVLRFQFTASTPRRGGGGNPLAGKIDQLSWALPLHVGAPQ